MWLTHEDKYVKVCKDFNLQSTNSIYLALRDGQPVGVSPLIRYLENAKTTTDDHLNDHFDDNLLEDSHLVKNADIITHGEKIADQLSKVKCVNPNILAS